MKRLFCTPISLLVACSLALGADEDQEEEPADQVTEHRRSRPPGAMVEGPAGPAPPGSHAGGAIRHFPPFFNATSDSEIHPLDASMW